MKQIFISPRLHDFLPLPLIKELYILVSALPATNRIQHFTLHSSNKGITIEHIIPSLGFHYQVFVSGFLIDAEVINVVAFDSGFKIRMALLGETLR